MFKFDSPPQFECRKTKTEKNNNNNNKKKKKQKKNTILGLNSNVAIDLRISKYDIRPQCVCRNKILNVKIRYSASVRMSKNEKLKAKNEKRKTKKQTNLTLLCDSQFYFIKVVFKMVKIILACFRDENY